MHTVRDRIYVFVSCSWSLVVAFEPVLRTQGSKELLDEYGELVANQGIIGCVLHWSFLDIKLTQQLCRCYLQTELAHGSNVASLETTATYIPETQEFEIHSPTFTSRKWWIGGAAKLSTHGVVQAKLILPDGKDMGPHLFFVQLRSLGALLRGILPWQAC